MRGSPPATRKNPEWQCDLAVCHERIGDLRFASGDREDALVSYRRASAIRELWPNSNQLSLSGSTISRSAIIKSEMY